MMSANACCSPPGAGLTHISTVNDWKLNHVPRSTESLIPSKLNACPTSPGAKVVPPCSVPGLPSQISLALPSPGHQLTMSGGGGTHDGVGVGVGVAVGVGVGVNVAVGVAVGVAVAVAVGDGGG